MRRSIAFTSILFQSPRTPESIVSEMAHFRTFVLPHHYKPFVGTTKLFEVLST